MTNDSSKGINKDEGKLRLDLVPPEVIEAFALVSGSSLSKYPERNWEKGIAWMRQYASAMRHLMKWVKGEDIDEESGLPHIKMAMWRLGALVTYYDRGIGEDNRPRKDQHILDDPNASVEEVIEEPLTWNWTWGPLQDEGRGDRE